MMKIYVKWDFTDDYGWANPNDAIFNWFETKEEAEEFIAGKRKGNGGYFKVWKVAEGNKDNYDRMVAALKVYNELKNEF